MKANGYEVQVQSDVRIVTPRNLLEVTANTYQLHRSACSGGAASACKSCAMSSTIPLFKVFMAPPEQLDAPVLDVLHSGYVTQGPKVEEFEEMLRRFFGNPRVLTLNSATSGLHLALHLLGKRDGDWPGLIEQVDEVLTCPLTCTASNWPILANRLRIKWVDADPATCMMDLDDLEAKLTPTTKVILLVHWGGTPIDLDRVARIKEVSYEKYGFRPQVIEDCAHAFGAEHKQLKLGNHGNLCVFSLQARAPPRPPWLPHTSASSVSVPRILAGRGTAAVCGGRVWRARAPTFS